MPIVRKTKADLKDFSLTPRERARLDAMTDAEITAAARSDPDNPPISAAEFKRMEFAAMTPYGAIIDGQSGAYGVVIPDLPGCTAMGKTVNEAWANIVEAAAAWGRIARADGYAVPKPRPVEVLLADPEVKAALAAGGVLDVIPVIVESPR